MNVMSKFQISKFYKFFKFQIFENFSLYNVMLMMIASFTANTFVSSYFWLEIALFYSIVVAIAKETGMPVIRFRVMDVPLKNMLYKATY